MDEEKLVGYQRLEQDFFRLCGIRKIKHSTMLMLIYLRGLYCRFGKPNFHWTDKNIVKDLGLSYRQINRIRNILQEKGVIEFTVFKGRGKATEYFILKTELAPILKPAKMSGLTCQNVRFYQNNSSTKTCQNVRSIVNNIVKKEKENFFNQSFLKTKNIETKEGRNQREEARRKLLNEQARLLKIG